MTAALLEVRALQMIEVRGGRADGPQSALMSLYNRHLEREEEERGLAQTPRTALRGHWPRRHPDLGLPDSGNKVLLSWSVTETL